MILINRVLGDGSARSPNYPYKPVMKHNAQSRNNPRFESGNNPCFPTVVLIQFFHFFIVSMNGRLIKC